MMSPVVLVSHEDDSVFELFFRKPPFGGEFTIFAGLEECVRFISTFRFSPSDVDLLSKKFPTWKPAFWSWLAAIDCSKVKLFAIEEGTVVFPREPLLRVEGPLAICQVDFHTHSFFFLLLFSPPPPSFLFSTLPFVIGIAYGFSIQCVVF
jgi:nicotinic acid phosphoribosyltransferase